MTKEVKGWREKGWNSSSEIGRAILEMVTGEDGWFCPHCDTKEELGYCEDITHETYHRLMDDYEKIDICCRHCGKYYFLKCHIRRNYYSCMDDKFEE